MVTDDARDKLSAGRVANLGIGMLCFARDMSLAAFKNHVDFFPPGKKDNAGTIIPAKRRRITQATAPGYGPGERTERTVEAFELTSLNEYLRQGMDWEKPLDNYHPTVSDLFSTARQVIEAFPMIGVILTEVAPSNDSNYGRRDAMRIINFAVKGRCTTFNLWSSQVPTGTGLYLIVKKVPHPKGGARMVWFMEPYPRGWRNKEKDQTLEEKHAPRPTAEDLCWEEDGVIHVGETIYVGRSGQMSGDVCLDADRELARQGLFHKKMMGPSVETFLRI